MRFGGLFAALCVAVACQAQTHTTVTLKPGDTLLVVAPAAATPPPSPPGTISHEPAGMTAVINTGHITAASATFGVSGSDGTLTITGPIPAVWTIFSPIVMTPTGEQRANLVLDSAGGMAVVYLPSLSGGNSPVRFGTPMHPMGTGTLYFRESIRASNYSAPSTANGIKVWEPRTSYQGGTTGENHVIGTRGSSTDVHTAYPYFFLQGPNGQSRNLSPTVSTPINIFDGRRHTVEIVLTPEATSGAGNGTQTLWVDNVQQSVYNNVQYLAAGQVPGWPYLMCDPTYGGAPATVHPPSRFTVTHDSIYVSAK